MKLIDIIIPAYNSHKTISRTLFSICYQDIIDNVNVYIVNDCSDNDYSKEVQFFSKFINISEIKLDKNVGPGIARDIGIKQSKSKYIVFIDADDIFASPNSLKILLDNIESNKADIVVGRFIEESDTEFVQHYNDIVWLHGKIYRRRFLEKNDINFNYNSSRANEDNGFNQLLLLNSPKIIYIDDAIYFWCYTENSITTQNSRSYNIEGVVGYLENIIYALEKGIENNCNIEKISELALTTMYTVYYYYLESDNEELISKSKKLKKIYEKYEVSDLNRKEEIIIEQFKTIFDKSYNKKSLYSMRLSFEKFLELVENFK